VRQCWWSLVLIHSTVLVVVFVVVCYSEPVFMLRYLRKK
jgi:hypothetical protein